jgi:hypothetical protein
MKKDFVNEVKIKNINNINNVNNVKDAKADDIENMLHQIVEEQNKLEKLTKKLSHKSTDTKAKTHKANNISITKPITEVNSPLPQKQDNAINNHTELQTFKMQLDGEHEIKQQLQLKTTDFKNVSKETVNKILDLLKNYINMDKSFRLKHDSLKTLYTAYLDLYKKYKDSEQNASEQSSGQSSGQANTITESKHSDMLKNIHQEMKENNSNLYRERLIILKKIKETPDIDHQMKNQICGRLIAVFKSPPIPEYKPLQLLKPVDSTNNNYQEEKISVNELDSAYLQKHNELLTVFKAYQNLYNKVLNYKDQLEKYKNLSTGSSISRCEMEKMIKDQRFVMGMIDKMQDNLVDNKIIDNSEKVLVTPVASHPENMGAFNNTMRDQIKYIIDRNLDINPNTKNKIENLLSQYKECDSNDEFCNAGRKLILLKKM